MILLDNLLTPPTKMLVAPNVGAVGAGTVGTVVALRGHRPHHVEAISPRQAASRKSNPG